MGLFSKLFNLCPTVKEFIEGAKNGDIHITIEYINKGGNINAKNEYFTTALQLASSEGHIKIVKLLLENGADTEHCLMYAIPNEHLKIMDLLIQYGADINRRDSRYKTPLIEACSMGKIKSVKFLLENGANPNLGFFGISPFPGDPGRSPLIEAKKYGYNDIVKLLKQYGA